MALLSWLSIKANIILIRLGQQRRRALARPGLVVLLLALFLLTAAVISLYSQDRWHIEHMPTYLFFGVASVASLGMGIWIKASLKELPFQDNQALLDRFIDIFADATGGGSLCLLHLCPNPGQFDYHFLHKGSFPTLQRVIKIFAKAGKATEVKLAVLGGRPNQNNFGAGGHVTLHPEVERFADIFFKGERQDYRSSVSENALGIYKNHLANYMNELAECLDSIPEDILDVKTLKPQILDAALQGDEVVILGASTNRAFLGTISFSTDGRFRFRALNVNAPGIVRDLYEALVAQYAEPDAPPPAQRKGQTAAEESERAPWGDKAKTEMDTDPRHGDVAQGNQEEAGRGDV